MADLRDLLINIKKQTSGDLSEVELHSAKRQPKSVVDQVRSALGDVTVREVIDPELVGGIRIKVGDHEYEATLKDQLDRLRTDFSNLGDEKDVTSSLKDKLEKFNADPEVSEVGTITELKDGMAKVSGIGGTLLQEVLLFPEGIRGLALNLEVDSVGVIIFGEFEKLRVGDKVKRSGKVMTVPVGEELIGRVINSIGEPVDGKGDIETSQENPVEKVAPGVVTRTPVNTPLQTGIKAIDGLIPIGRGQRELILGDRQTGKTAIAIDTIINQKGEDVICIYVAIGQKESKVARIAAKLEDAGAMDYTTIVTASASEAAPMLYLAPYSGVALGEYFADKGKDVLIIYDDLTKHAIAYREMSLLLRRPPGREAYPGDVFYLHSRLLERACNLNENYGGGSITALPIIETQAGDVSAYVPTNVISITDGQIFLETDLFYKGVRPAVNVGTSVSRVGGSAQIKSMKKVAGKVKLSLAQFRELEAFAQFSSDLDPKTKAEIERGRRVSEALKQEQYKPFAVEDQIISMYAVNNGYFDKIAVQDVTSVESELLDYAKTYFADLKTELRNGNWSDEIEEELKKLCQEFIDQREQ